MSSKKVFLVGGLVLMGIVLVWKRVKVKEIVVEKPAEILETIAPRPTKITEIGIPDKHLIKTAFVEQAPEKNWDQPWQDACEEAALLTVDYFYKSKVATVTGIKEDILKMLDFESEQGWGHDVDIKMMAKISEDYLGYKAEIFKDPSVSDLKKLIAKGVPVVIPANGKTLYRENRNFKDGGPWYHSLVILGYDDSMGKFIVHDVGTRKGAYFRYSYDLLLTAIHDFPASGKKEDIDLGDKKVLILIK